MRSLSGPVNAPGPQAQLEFLQNVQRLLDEGAFSATYKFALMLALADLCVERGQDTNAAFRVETAQLAEKFIAFYWRQARPYVHPSHCPPSAVLPLLQQNTGQPAAVLTTLKRYADQGWTLADLRRSGKHWPPLVEKVRRVNRLNGEVLAERFTHAKIVHDLPGSTRIAWWAYQQAATIKASTWTKGTQLEVLSPDWIDSFEKEISPSTYPSHAVLS